MASKLLFPTPVARPGSQSLEASAATKPSAAGLRRLVQLLGVHAPYDGVFKLVLPGVHVIRRSHPSEGLVYATRSPALCVIAQGAKRVMLGPEVYEYDASRMLVYAV